jgi:cell division protein FtsL
MKKLFLLLCLISIPCMIFITIWQSFSYEKLNREILLLEAGQENKIEQNKRAIASIAVLSSPARIAQIAKSKLGLLKIKPGSIQYITLPGTGERDG